MTRVVWTEAAINDLHAIKEYPVDTHSAAFARHVIETLIGATQSLLRHPHDGERLALDGWRKWRPRKSQHVLTHRMVENGIEALRARHERSDLRRVPLD